MEITDYKKFKEQVTTVIMSKNKNRALTLIKLNKSNMKTLKEKERFLWEIIRDLASDR